MTSDYEKYVDRYSTAREISREAAEAHLMVKGVKKYYENTVRDAVSGSDTNKNGDKPSIDS